MNFFNDDDRETSIRVCTIVRDMVAGVMKSDFMAGTYACAWDDGRTAALNGFLGSKILESNLLLSVETREQHPTPGLLTQEVSYFNNVEPIATRMMQVLIFPTKIVSKMNDMNQRNHRKLTPRSLYTCIRAVLRLINKEYASVVLAGVVDCPLDKSPILLPLPLAQSKLPNELVLFSTIIPVANLYIRMNGRT